MTDGTRRYGRWLMSRDFTLAPRISLLIQESVSMMDPQNTSKSDLPTSSDNWDAEDDVDYHLQPVVGMSRDEMEAQFVDPDLLKLAKDSPPEAELASSPSWRIQFSLKQMVLFMSCASVGFASARWLENGLFTFIATLAVLGALGYASREGDHDPVSSVFFAGTVSGFVALLFVFRMIVR